MPKYSYLAISPQGERVEGVIEADHRDEVASSLSAKGLQPVRIKAATRLDFLVQPRGSKVKREHVLQLTKELADLLEAGVPLERALLVAADASAEQAVKDVLENIRLDIQGGKTLSAALASHPDLFNSLYVSMVKVGEMGGVLPHILRRLESFLKQSEEIRKFIVTSSIYPAILALVGIASVGILITFVVPKFGQIFEDLNQPMPFMTQLIFQLSTFLQSWWWALLLAVTGAGALFYHYIRTPEGKIWWDGVVLKIGFAGPMVRDMEVSRFSRTLGTLLESGVPILKGIRLAEEVVSNVHIKEAIGRIYAGVRQGKGISGIMRRSPYFPSLMVHLVAIGEETGSMGAMLLKVADDLDESIQHRTKMALALVEPITILVMGIIIGGIILSMLLAVFGINDVAM